MHQWKKKTKYYSECTQQSIIYQQQIKIVGVTGKCDVNNSKLTDSTSKAAYGTTQYII